MTHDDEAVAAGRILARTERPPQRRPYAKHIEQLGRHERAGEPHRLSETDQVERVIVRIRGDVECLHALTHGRKRSIGIGACDAHEPFRPGIRQRSEEHSIDDTEDGRVRTDAERQRERCDRRETRDLAERARTVS